MPYLGEQANKASHSDIIRNPDVVEFLKDAEYLTPPSEEEKEAIVALFQDPPIAQANNLPDQVIAIDGSLHEFSLDQQLPSTKVGYVKVGCILIEMKQFGELRVGNRVDPFRVAALQKNNSALSFPLPSANVRLKGTSSVRDAFRATVDALLYNPKTRFHAEDATTSLRPTLFHLASSRSGPLETGNPTRLKIHRCPTCDQGPIEMRDVPASQYCPHCGSAVYPSDCLRLWEEVADFQSNATALMRFMTTVEHLMPVHYVRYLRENSLPTLGGLAFFVDGPLAIFGTSAWLHGPIMRYFAEVNAQLEAKGLARLLVIGLQKTGQVVDHLHLIERFIPTNRILPISDQYRYKYIVASRDPSSNGFGSETYYGQDFIYKTPSGRCFVFALPYPFPAKQDAGAGFVQAKTEVVRYTELARTLALINHFELDLYRDSVIPIALAHKYTAISLVPGGRVLDLLTRRAFDQKA